MKYLSISVCTLLAIAATASAQTLVGPGSVKLGKVMPTFQKTPEYQLASGGAKRFKTAEWLEVEVDFDTKPEEIDELTFKYTILFDKKLLDGEVTHVNIRKGREHFSVVYVSPRSLDRIAAGKVLNPNMIENVWVEVSKQGQVLERSSMRPGVPPNLPHLPAMVMTKEETPFAPLYYDRYEATKKK